MVWKPNKTRRVNCMSEVALPKKVDDQKCSSILDQARTECCVAEQEMYMRICVGNKTFTFNVPDRPKAMNNSLILREHIRMLA